MVVATFHAKRGNKTNAEAHTGKEQSGSFGYRAGLHGHELCYSRPADRQEMMALLYQAVELGITFFDTAEAYGPFTNEELVGEALASFRGQVVIATKFGFKLGPNVLPTLEELGIGFVPFSPLGKGFLRGTINENTTFDRSDFRSTLPCFLPEARRANLALVDLLREIAARKGANPAQTALAWLFAQKSWIVPIPGTSKFSRLDENIGAVNVELTPDDLREIERAASQITIQGAHYPAALERRTGL